MKKPHVAEKLRKIIPLHQGIFSSRLLPLCLLAQEQSPSNNICETPIS